MTSRKSHEVTARLLLEWSAGCTVAPGPIYPSASGETAAKRLAAASPRRQYSLEHDCQLTGDTGESVPGRSGRRLWEGKAALSDGAENY